MRLRSFQNVMNLGSTDQVSELRVLKVVELQASQSCAIFGHLRTGRKCQVGAFQHVANTPRKTFPFRKLQLSPTSSHRDQSSTGGVHGPSLLASALAKQRWRVTRCSSVSSTSLDCASGTGLAVTVRERSSQLRDGTAKIRSGHGPLGDFGNSRFLHGFMQAQMPISARYMDS